MWLYYYCATLVVMTTVPQVMGTSNNIRTWHWSCLPYLRLSGYVLTTITSASKLSCLTECRTVPGCRTVNYQANGGICELNSADDRWDDGSMLKYDVNFTYFRIDIPTGPQSLDIDAECETGHLLVGNLCHEVFNGTSHNFSDAVTYCRRRYGHLAVLDTPAFQAILDLLRPFGRFSTYFIDLVRKGTEAADMYWGNGQKCPVSVPLWRTTEPTGVPQNCGIIAGSLINISYIGYKFWDEECNFTRGFICQYDPYVYLAW